MLCHYCEGIIDKNQKIHRGFDENFCSEYCLSQLFILNKDVDPNFNNYHKWLNNNLENEKKYYFNRKITKNIKINETIEKKDDKEKNNRSCCITKITFVNYIVFQIFPIYYKL